MTVDSGKGEAATQINRTTPPASNGLPKNLCRLAAARRYCRRLARRRYENFVVASLFLPRRYRQHFYNVYAFCRHADDLADESADAADATEQLRRWQEELDRCFEGSAEHPIFIALLETIRIFEIPRRPFDDLLDAFRQDQVKTRYADLDEVLDYCRRSANPVGQIVLRLADADSEDNLALADSICTGLQLANHWQDLKRDYAAGRIYLPQDRMARFGVEERTLADDCSTVNLRCLIAEQCGIARQHLNYGRELSSRVPPWLARDVRLYIMAGLETLDAVAAQGHDVLVRRPTISRWKKARMGMSLLFPRFLRRQI